MKTSILAILISVSLAPVCVSAKDSHSGVHQQVSDQVIQQQRDMLASNTKGKGFGPQSPRDIDSVSGSNNIIFNQAPEFSRMNLCNIHFHKNAEHKGGEFTKYTGNGDGHGFDSGYAYSGGLNAAELKPITEAVCPSKHGDLNPGDTIELHYVHSTAQVKPGHTLSSCFSDEINNPQLRVEAQVFVLVNDDKALNFSELTEFGLKNNVQQALNIPSHTGTPIQYAGSTTGPGFNEKGSYFQVSWGVRPNVAKVNISSVAKWCEGNEFKEDHAHGVRNLVINPDLLSEIKH